MLAKLHHASKITYLNAFLHYGYWNAFDKSMTNALDLNIYIVYVIKALPNLSICDIYHNNKSTEEVHAHACAKYPLQNGYKT